MNPISRKDPSAPKTPFKETKFGKLITSPTFWIAVGLVIVVIIILIIIFGKKRTSVLGGGNVTPEPVKLEDVDPEKLKPVSVSNMTEEERLNLIYSVSDRFVAAAQKMAANFQLAEEATDDFMLNMATELLMDGQSEAVIKYALDAYGDALSSYWGRVMSASADITKAIASTVPDVSKLTTCTSTVFNAKTTENATNVTNVVVTTNSPLGWVTKETTDTTTTTSHTRTIEMIPTCTSWGVEPSVLAAALAGQAAVMGGLYKALQSKIDGYPKQDKFIALAKKYGEALAKQQAQQKNA